MTLSLYQSMKQRERVHRRAKEDQITYSCDTVSLPAHEAVGRVNRRARRWSVNNSYDSVSLPVHEAVGKGEQESEKKVR